MHDSHTVCINCRGSVCNLEQRCDHCTSWSNERMLKIFKTPGSLSKKCRFKIRKKTKELEQLDCTAKERNSSLSEITSSDICDDSDMSIAGNNSKDSAGDSSEGSASDTSNKNSNNGLVNRAVEIEKGLDQESTHGLSNDIMGIFSTMKSMLDETLEKKLELERVKASSSSPNKTSLL